MNLTLKLAVSAVVSVLLLVGGIFTGEKLYQPVASTQQSFGSFTPVQGQTYTLQGAGVTATQNTIPLASFTTPDGRAITMSMFGTIGYGTLEPNTNSKIEDITFSGITQNTNGSATLTGVTRGNDFVTPYAASTTLAKAHAGGSYFILSNTAGFYGQQFLFANNAASSTATITFSNTNPPFYYPGPGNQTTGSPNATTSEFASIAYVNQVVASGAANATAAVKGIIQLATAVQAAAGTALGSTGASLVPPNSLFNATQSATTIIPVTNTSGKLAQAFLDLTQAFTLSTTTTYNANFGRVVATSSQASYFQFASTSAITSITASTTNLIVSGTCTAGNGKTCANVNIVTNTFTGPNSTVGSTASGAATCASGQVVSGGGFSGISNNGALVFQSLQNSQPSGTTAWNVGLICAGTGGGSCSGGTITVYAICQNP